MSRRKLSTVLINEAGATLKRIPSKENYQAVDYELNKFTGVTTFHGLVRLYSGKWYAKLFWASVVGVATVLFVGQVTILVRTLAAKPVTSKVQFLVPPNGIRFPSVTVCNFNPVMKYYTDRLKNVSAEFTDDVEEYLLLSYLQVESLYERYSHDELHTLHHAFLNYTNIHPHFDINTFFLEGGSKCEDMFLSCAFGGAMFNCCKHAGVILTDVGKCFQFHNYSSQEWRNYQYISGSFYGLQLILNVNKTQYGTIYRENSFETGVRFFVHQRGVMPFLSTGGFSASPGYRLYAGVVPAHYQLLPKDQWGSCKPSWELEEEHFTEYYTAMNCETHCVAKQFSQKCNCTPLRYNIDKSYNICSPLDLYRCINVTKWDVEDEEYWYKKCPQCEIECDRWDYDLETSYTSFFNDGAMQYFEKAFGLRENQVKSNVVILDIYIKELAHTEFQQQPGTSLTETLSDIGGNMGMFIGASIVTIAEIVVFLGKVFWSWVSKKRRSAVVHKVSSVASFHPQADISTLTGGRPIQFWMDDEESPKIKSGTTKKVHFSYSEDSSSDEDYELCEDFSISSSNPKCPSDPNSAYENPSFQSTSEHVLSQGEEQSVSC